MISQHFSFHYEMPKNFTGKCHIGNLHWTGWYVEGKLHREDGPALIHNGGEKEWHLHGKLHRLDGPAIVDGGLEIYYIDGKNYTLSNFIKKRIDRKLQNILNCEDV